MGKVFQLFVGTLTRGAVGNSLTYSVGFRSPSIRYVVAELSTLQVPLGALVALISCY